MPRLDLKTIWTLLACGLATGCAGASAPADGSVASPAPLAASDSAAAVRNAAHPLTGAAGDLDPLMRAVGDASFVLLGEATHGTHEFYAERARISRRLIEEKGFSGIAIEGDWPDAERVNRYVRGIGPDSTPEQALSSFTRFPQWMWRNTDVRDLIRWMRSYNATRPPEQRVGFYGFDLYSLYRSIDQVVEILGRIDPEAAARARERYRCFGRYGEEPEAYGAAAATTPARSCEDEARAVFAELEQRLGTAPPNEDPARAEMRFSALQNARVVKNAEEYYRTAFQGGISGWNLRDRHMAETVEALAAHLRARGGTPRLALWAHNTHMGDARVTEPGEQGEWSVGQLLRQRFPRETVLVGFTTYTGMVTAARGWGQRGEVRPLRPALPGSYSALFHQVGIPRFLLVFRGNESLQGALAEPRIERAVGVVYLPQTERQSHYFRAILSRQFDAVIHVDTTRAVEALRR
jgi:erythromycin esterase-like protein